MPVSVTIASPADEPTSSTGQNPGEGEARSGGAGRFSPRRAWTAVVLLTLVGIVNQVDRLLPGVLVEPIKHDLHLSDTSMGLINGFGFVVVYALMGLPIARLSDRGIYGLIITSCLTLWSSMTLLGAMAQNGVQLALTRMGVALGEAGSTPAAHAFIARNFSPARRAAPIAVLTLSIPFASMSALLGGGLAAETLGWRATLIGMGVLGLVITPFVLLALGPRQPLLGAAGEGASPATISLSPAFGLLKKPSFLLTLLGTSCIGIGGYSQAAFSASFLVRVHGLSLSEVGVRYGIVVGVGGVISVLAAGLIADKLAVRDPRWILWMEALAIGALLPFSYAAFLVPNVWAAMGCMALANFASTFYLAPVVAAIQRLAPSNQRATASAMLMMFTALAGGAGPFITGMISDALLPTLGAKSLGPALLVVPVAQTLAMLFYLAATVRFRRDMAPEELASA
jgi:predicted MFS family arabinose efflux permease